MDYVNSTDYVVRMMEIGLGLQYGGIQKENEWNLSDRVHHIWESNEGDEGERSVINEGEAKPFVNFKNSIEFDKIDDTFDDVFANNPSNLMLAKVKVKKKPEMDESSNPLNPCQWKCKKWKWFNKNSLSNQKIGLNFSQDGNLLIFKDYPVKKENTKYASEKSTTTQPTVISFKNTKNMK